MNRYVYLRVSYTIAAVIDKIIVNLIHALCVFKSFIMQLRLLLCYCRRVFGEELIPTTIHH